MAETADFRTRGGDDVKLPRKVRSEDGRRRGPRPLLPYRLPSGRGATEQPNAVGDELAPLTPRFWTALLVTGIATGLLGALLMLLLFSMQHLTYGYHLGDFESAVMRATPRWRVEALLLAGAIGGMAWYVLRRATKEEHSELDDALWRGDARVSFRRSLGSSVISEIVVGMGASLGRENAPKLMGGASGSLVSNWFGLTTGQRRLLVACAGGAGLAAVYNVPLGGALFAVELLYGKVALPAVLPALACSLIATATSYVYLPVHATYTDVPPYAPSGSLGVWAIIAGPLIGLVATVYIRLIGWVSAHRARGFTAVVVSVLAFGVVGTMGVGFPQLFGNGKDMAHDAFLGSGTLGLFLALAALKPLATSFCLGSGASGGLFTPTMSTGAMLGGFLGLLWGRMWEGPDTGAFALVGGAAMIGASMQAPLSGVVLMLELTHSGFRLMLPMLAATVLATVVARRLDGYSIYSARLPAS